MHDDLKECVESAKRTRARLMAGQVSVKEANAVAGQNHTVISAYAVDLRIRIFAPDEDGVRRVERLNGMIETRDLPPTDDAG